MSNQQVKEIYVSALEIEVIDAFRKPTVFFIQGKRGSGKTDFSLLMGEIASTYSMIDQFASNIKIFDTPIINYEYIDNLEDLTSWCQTRQGKKLYIFDETGKAIRRRTPMSKLNIEVLDQIQILRKYELRIIFIAPANTYVDSAIFGTDVLDYIITKPSNENQKIALWNNLNREEEIIFTGVQKCSTKFDSFDIAPFTKTSPNKKSRFSDENLNLLWDWSNGASYKTLGVHNMQLSRILRRFVKAELEKQLNSTQ